ncbi:MAG: DUF1648 domain-containing protein [Clostridiaceae bacterium]|nr:DUF1648 domain-containing protein [Eubacteriales bacterium]MDD4744547.1 DUF1648 domain-containing protein [Eubacteriales bacterium]NLB44135.1 DUF1648 domain-containing protein [Clostridiaceae bacterium]
MNKNNRTIVWVTSIICLLPFVYSALAYTSLPERIAIHWNSAGVPDNWAHKAVAAFGLPFLFLAINLYSKMRLLNDPRREGQSQAIRQISIWLIPAASIVLVPVTLQMAMGARVPIVLLGSLLVGLLLVIFGNNLPKNRQNYTIGFKLPWTLNDADNWNKVHRLAGYLWIAGGLGLIAGSFLLRQPLAHIALTALVVVVLVLVPSVYSYSLYKQESGHASE